MRLPSVAPGRASVTTGSTAFWQCGHQSRWIVCSVTTGVIGLGNVFGDPSPCLIGPGQWPVTFGTGFEAMIGASIRFGRRPPRAGMSGLAAGAFATAAGLGLEIGWDHRRGSRRSDGRCRRGLGIDHFLSQCQEREDDGFLALAIDFPCLVLGESRSKENGSGKGWIRHRLGSKGYAKIFNGSEVKKAR